MVKAGIVGAAGYSGKELIRILNAHPDVDVVSLTDKQFIGAGIAEVFPEFLGQIDTVIEDFDVQDVSDLCDVVFLALPHGISCKYVPSLLDNGVRVIDISADYRLKDTGSYQKWYGLVHPDGANLKKAVYGLPELNREKIINTDLLANPGCYPTAILLGLLPVGKIGLNDTFIIADAKTGVSGGGRKPVLPFHFAECNESVRAYKTGVHSHTSEIEMILKDKISKDVSVLFSPHLVPMNRGILATIYIRYSGMDKDKILKTYESFYSDAPFVNVLKEGCLPSTKDVIGTNYCQIGLVFDERTGMMIVVSVIDNLIKGASGQAVQNMNLMFNLEETAGIK
ncbi:MAG: N-acetyl-gamma-glutamyl-phosphate reductase [Candidatus Theseobacter exili]|nr:N-acetyl-gamma-glutamyl-phosphate reductase [Candidatus Theseobacter exili]